MIYLNHILSLSGFTPTLNGKVGVNHGNQPFTHHSPTISCWSSHPFPLNKRRLSRISVCIRCARSLKICEDWGRRRPSPRGAGGAPWKMAGFGHENWDVTIKTREKWWLKSFKFQKWGFDEIWAIKNGNISCFSHLTINSGDSTFKILQIWGY